MVRASSVTVERLSLVALDLSSWYPEPGLPGITP